MKRGRPDKAALAKRADIKAQWQREQDLWSRKLERADTEPVTLFEMFEGLDDAAAILLMHAVESPALQFVVERMVVADGAEDRTQAQADAAFYQSLRDLLESDVPLDRNIRKLISSAIGGLTHPDEYKQGFIPLKAAIIENQLAALQRRGETREAALKEIAKAWDHASGEALHKWLLKVAAPSKG